MPDRYTYAQLAADPTLVEEAMAQFNLPDTPEGGAQAARILMGQEAPPVPDFGAGAFTRLKDVAMGLGNLPGLDTLKGAYQGRLVAPGQGMAEAYVENMKRALTSGTKGGQFEGRPFSQAADVVTSAVPLLPPWASIDRGIQDGDWGSVAVDAALSVLPWMGKVGSLKGIPVRGMGLGGEVVDAFKQQGRFRPAPRDTGFSGYRGTPPVAEAPLNGWAGIRPTEPPPLMPWQAEVGNLPPLPSPTVPANMSTTMQMYLRGKGW